MIAWGQREYSCDRGPDNCIHKNTWYLPDIEYLPETSRPLDSSDQLLLLGSVSFSLLFRCFNDFHLRSFVVLVIFNLSAVFHFTDVHKPQDMRFPGSLDELWAIKAVYFSSLWTYGFYCNGPFHADFNLNFMCNMQQSLLQLHRGLRAHHISTWVTMTQQSLIHR